MHNLTASPKGGDRENGTASILHVIAYIIWGLGLIGGIIWGAKAGKLSNYSYYSYEEEQQMAFSWGTAFIIWGSAFLSGLFPFVFAEIICLLQKGNTISYAIEKNGYERTTEETGSNDEKDKNTKKHFNLSNDDQKVPFFLCDIAFFPEEYGKTGAILGVQWQGGYTIEGILCDIILTTIYDESYKVKDISFVNLVRNEVDFVSEPSILNISDNVFNSIKHISLVIKKFVVNNEVHVPGDEFCLDSLNPTTGDGARIDAFLNEIENMERVSEIAAYVHQMSKMGDPIVTKELTDIINKEGYAEKTQGNSLVNHRDKCVQKIMEMYGYDYTPPQRTNQQNTRQTAISLNRPSQSMPPLNRQPQQDTYEEDDYYGDDEQLFCIKCGSKIDDKGALFCPVCGERVIR